MLNEEVIVKQLREKSPHFIGDDAAILPIIEGSHYAMTKDILVEDIHFRTTYYSPQDLAHKALHVNLSDLAAMGANPLYLLCGIAIPTSLGHYAQEFLKALIEVCEKANVTLIGGDTTASKQKLLISITAIGLGENFKYRNTAQESNIICVAGNLGWAHLGFTSLEKEKDTANKYVESFLRPTAKIKEGLWLAQQEGVTAMMDISDGLYIDLKRLCEASHKGAVLNLNQLSTYLTPELSLSNLLEGGEDYGLLFTCKKEKLSMLSQAFRATFAYDLKTVGYLTNTSQILMCKDNHDTAFSVVPFSHF